MFCRIDTLPKSLHELTKTLFKFGVCLKPQLIRNGIEGIHSLTNVEDQIKAGRLNKGKFSFIISSSIRYKIFLKIIIYSMITKHFIYSLFISFKGKMGDLRGFLPKR